MNIQTEKAYIGWYATDADIYDGAPDTKPPASLIGWGKTPDEAKADLLEQLDEFQ